MCSKNDSNRPNTIRCGRSRREFPSCSYSTLCTSFMSFFGPDILRCCVCRRFSFCSSCTFFCQNHPSAEGINVFGRAQAAKRKGLKKYDREWRGGRASDGYVGQEESLLRVQSMMRSLPEGAEPLCFLRLHLMCTPNMHASSCDAC